MAPTSTQNGTQNYKQMSILAQRGGGKGYPEINTNMKIKKNANAKKQHQKKHFDQLWGYFLKNRSAQRLGAYCGIMKNSDQNVTKKSRTEKQKRSQSSS